MSTTPHSPVDQWPAEIGFVPFVGRNYEAGIEGCRVLILGESHYAPKAETKVVDRGLTRVTFNECEDETSNRAWRTFFRRCDQLLTRNTMPMNAEAADAWSHASFANYIPELVGTAARQRPTAEHWEQAKRAFPMLLSILKPDAILVLGSQLWDNLPDAGTQVHTIPAPRCDRNVWRIEYEGGNAMMTWVYHPSWPNEKPEGYVDVFKALLRYTRDGIRKPS